MLNVYMDAQYIHGILTYIWIFPKGHSFGSCSTADNEGPHGKQVTDVCCLACAFSAPTAVFVSVFFQYPLGQSCALKGCRPRGTGLTWGSP